MSLELEALPATVVLRDALLGLAPADVFITEQLRLRAPKKTDYLQEKLALQDLARQMADHPADVLPHLVDLAIEICGGTSGGISLYEENPSPGVFRWHYLRGNLQKFTGETTPRDFSPCGVTLDLRTPVLAEHPERYYSWLAEAGIALPECLLVPLYVGGEHPLGTLWIVSPSKGHFDSGHARIMTELAGFAGIALSMVSTEERLQQALVQQETLTKEMGYRVENLFAIIGGMIRVSARASATPQQMSDILSGRLLALAAAHALVRRTFDYNGMASQGADLHEIVSTILQPHDGAGVRFKIEGPPIRLGDHTTNGFALALHELATNAAKYGALKTDTGSIQVCWQSKNDCIVLTWQERGGPAIGVGPTKHGFGSVLLKNTVVGQLGGTLSYDWQSTGVLVTISVPVENLLA